MLLPSQLCNSATRLPACLPGPPNREDELKQIRKAALLGSVNDLVFSGGSMVIAMAGERKSRLCWIGWWTVGNTTQETGPLSQQTIAAVPRPASALLGTHPSAPLCLQLYSPMPEWATR